MNGTGTTFDRHGRQKQNLRKRAHCFMGYGIKLFSPAHRNDVIRLPRSMYLSSHHVQLIDILFRYAPHYGIIMHTSYLPTGQRSRLKEVSQMQISRRRRDNQFFLEGEYDLGQGPQES